MVQYHQCRLPRGGRVKTVLIESSAWAKTGNEKQGNEKQEKQGHIPFNLTSTPLSDRISTWQESHELLQPVSPIM